jgi:hypothetical protein
VLQVFGLAEKRLVMRCGRDIRMDADVNWTSIKPDDTLPFCAYELETVALMLSAVGCVGKPSGGVGVAGSKPDARSCAISGFSAAGGAGVTLCVGGVLFSCGWKGRDGSGGGGVG